MADHRTILLNDREAAALLGISRATLWRHSRTGALPSPIRIVGSTRWRLSELVDVVDRACAGRDGELAESADAPVTDGGENDRAA